MTTKPTESAPELLVDARPKLVRAFLAVRGEEGAEDAASEAVAWGLENTDRLMSLDNPVGYLYRVGLTRTTKRKAPRLRPPTAALMPDVHPELISELLKLSEHQRAAVWLVHACRWSYADVAEALSVGTSTVGTHVSRGLAALRCALSETTPTTEQDDE